MQNVIAITKESNSKALITLKEALLGLKLTAGVNDDLITMMIDQCSDEIATICHRVFAKSTVIETFRDISDGRNELFLSYFPVKTLTAVTEDGTMLDQDVDFDLVERTGRLVRIGASWGTEVAINYTGGYDCPFDVPGGLRHAAMLYVREAYYGTVRGDQSIRMLGHKESRIIYFDPNAALRALGGGGGAGALALAATATQRAVRNLLSHYTRYAI